jgi:hypothetical protein
MKSDVKIKESKGQESNEAKPFEINFFLIGFIIFLAAVIPYFVHFIPNAYYEAYASLGFLFIALVLLTAISTVKEKLKSFNSFFYAILTISISIVLELVYDFSSISVFFYFYEILMVAGYLMFAISVYFLMQDVYIQLTKKKIIISSLIIIAIVAAFTYFYFNPIMHSNVSNAQKFYALIIPTLDVILAAGVALIMVSVKSAKFWSGYAGLLVAIVFLIIGDLIDVNYRLATVGMFWNYGDVFIFISYLFAVQFVNTWNKALSKDFNQIFELF